MRVIIALICLTLCAGVNSSRAELQLQPTMEQKCQPAKPAGHSVVRWKAQHSCSNDCFTSQLTCTNGKKVSLQSAINPDTTQLQWTIFNWAPWSLVVYLLALLGYATLATIGTELLVPQLVLNLS